MRGALGLVPSELRGARAQVLDFSAAPGVNAGGGHQTPRYILDAVIYPASPDDFWLPEALSLRAAAAASSPSQQAEESCRMLCAEVLENRRFRPAARQVCKGPRRVRLSLRVPESSAPLTLCYGDRSFTCILPQPAVEMAEA